MKTRKGKDEGGKDDVRREGEDKLRMGVSREGRPW